MHRSRVAVTSTSRRASNAARSTSPSVPLASISRQILEMTRLTSSTIGRSVEVASEHDRRLMPFHEGSCHRAEPIEMPLLGQPPAADVQANQRPTRAGEKRLSRGEAVGWKLRPQRRRGMFDRRLRQTVPRGPRARARATSRRALTETCTPGSYGPASVRNALPPPLEYPTRIVGRR